MITPLIKLIYPLRVYGTENIPKNGKLIVCSNHKSVIDPVFLALRFPRQIRYMGKSELFEDHGPLIRRLIYALGAFPVRRDKGDTQSVKTAVRILNEDGVVGIFPQGKCVFDNTPFKPKAGAVLVASKAEAPVLPACVYCDGLVRPFHRITVRFGKVIPFEELNLKQNSGTTIREAAGIVSRQINLLLEEKH